MVGYLALDTYACHNKRREFQNDALIALTARGRGATVVTANRVDFALLEQLVPISTILL
jgi:predicted nucleic acid-binding protein